MHNSLIQFTNSNSNNQEFDNYLKRLGYKFKNDNQDFGGYIIRRDKKTCLALDAGSTPNSKFTENYQSGALSFEIIRNQKKLISNCGYFRENDKLNQISKSSATHNTLVIGYNSSNIDLIKNEKIINISAILNSTLIGDKTIYELYVFRC